MCNKIMGTSGYLVNSRIFCMQTLLCNIHVTFTVPLLFTDVNIYIPLNTPDRIKVQYFPSNKQVQKSTTQICFNIAFSSV